MNYNFSTTAQDAHPSDIRNLLKLAQNEEMISFAGGNPDPSLFPQKEVTEAVVHFMEKEGIAALQYGPTDGYPPLRKLIADKRMKSAGVQQTSMDQVMITTGSQQGLDLIGKAFLNPGDRVICESPTYSGAINAFRPRGISYHAIPLEDDGMNMLELEETLQKDPKIKLIYVIPDFQNPSGSVMSLEKRMKLLELAEQYQIPVIEDGPYSEISFQKERLPSLISLDKSGVVIYNGSFSKIFSPGMRVAWIYAQPEIVQKLAVLKQGADLQTSSFDQRLIAYYMQEHSLDEDIKKITEFYREKCYAMLDEMEKSFPKDLEYIHPQGGFFIWIKFKEGLNAREVLEYAKNEKVLFVPGNGFFPNGGGENYARLCYTTSSIEQIHEGIRRLGKVLKNFY